MYKLGMNRNDIFFTSLEDLVDENSYARVVDAFVDSLDLESMGFKYASCKSSGNRPYNPADLLKLYLLGYRYKIRSSRRLEHQTIVNIEFIWILNNLKPNFRTISDFRKDNHSLLKDVFIKFNLDCQEMGFKSSIMSQDGCKVKAVNSKDNNFTASKLDDRKQHATETAEQYLSMLETNDNNDNFKDLSIIDKVDNILENIDSINFNDDSIDKNIFISKLTECQNKLKKYEKIENQMITNKTNQVSLTDPQSRLMKDNDRFTVGYNNQVLVDSNHFVKNFELTDNPADLGSMTSICSDTKETYDIDILTNITDKGYNKREDMISSLENGIIPEVTPHRGQNEFVLETDYEENIITEEELNSTDSKDITKCLKAGSIPNAYQDIITNIEVKEVTKYETTDNTVEQNQTEDELRDMAINNGWFTRHLNSNKVFCPMGEILRQKSSNDNRTRYCNKLACKNCKNPCCKNKQKTVDFKNNQTIYIPKDSKINNNKSHTVK